MKNIKIDFSDVEKVINEITDKHADQIKNNESFQALLNKLSEENDKRWGVVEDLVKLIEGVNKQVDTTIEHSITLRKMVGVIETRLSALEIAVAHIEKGNEKYIEWNDNLQSQIDTLAGELTILELLSSNTTTFSDKKEK